MKNRWSPVKSAEHRRGLATEARVVGVECQRQARQVADVLAERQVPVDVRARQRLVAVVLRRQCFGRLW